MAGFWRSQKGGSLGRAVVVFIVAFAVRIGCVDQQSGWYSYSPLTPLPQRENTEPEPDPPPFFVAFGNAILTSADGVTWKPRESPIGNFQTAAYGNNRIVAYGGYHSENFAVSEDGAEWTETHDPLFANLSAITFGADKFVAVGLGSDPLSPEGNAFVSADGINWIPAAGNVPKLNSVAYGDSEFIAVGYGEIATSPDGLQWTGEPFEYPRQIFDVVRDNGTFVITGNAGSVFTSPDGAAWTEQQSGLSDIFSSEA